jgi:hypothetical protein
MRHSAEGPGVRSVISEVQHLNRDCSKKLPVFLTDKVPNAAFLSQVVRSTDRDYRRPAELQKLRKEHLGYVAGKRLSLYTANISRSFQIQILRVIA